MNATSTLSSPLRVLIVYDKQTNANPPAVTDVVQTDAIFGMMNLGNSRRFETLMDIIVPCIGTQGPQSCYESRYKVLDHVIEFNAGTAGNVNDIQTGSVYMLTWNDGTIGVASPNNNIYTRIRFRDL